MNKSEKGLSAAKLISWWHKWSATRINLLVKTSISSPPQRGVFAKVKLLLPVTTTRHVKMTGPPLRGQKFLAAMTTNVFDKPFQRTVPQKLLVNKLEQQSFSIIGIQLAQRIDHKMRFKWEVDFYKLNTDLETTIISKIQRNTSSKVSVKCDIFYSYGPWYLGS